MSDVVDLANDHAAMLLHYALEAQRRKSAGSNLADADWRVHTAGDCEGPHCGEPIPEERRRLVPGVRLCVTCQQRLARGYCL